MTRPAPAFSACLVLGGEDDGQERWLEHWDVARSARASVTCVVTGLVPEPSALYPLDSDRVVLMLCFASELRTAAAGWTVLTEIPTNSVRATALASWGMWERRRTECVLSVRRRNVERCRQGRYRYLSETLRTDVRQRQRFRRAAAACMSPSIHHDLEPSRASTQAVGGAPIPRFDIWYPST